MWDQIKHELGGLLDGKSVLIGMLMLFGPRLLFSLFNFFKPKEVFKERNPFKEPTQWGKIIFCTLILFFVLFAYRFTHPIEPNYYSVIGGNPDMSRSKLYKLCQKLKTQDEELTTQQEFACETFEKRLFKNYYDHFGPDYRKCKTCRNDKNYFLRTQIGFLVSWAVTSSCLLFPITTSSRKMKRLQIPLLILIFVFIVLQLALFLVLDLVSFEQYVNFELAYLSADVFWAIFWTLTIFTTFTGGDFRTNKDILVNVARMLEIEKFMIFSALLPQQIPYQDEKQRERLAEKLKEKDGFCNKLYPKIQNLKAYASAGGIIYGLTEEEPLKPLNLGDPQTIPSDQEE